MAAREKACGVMGEYLGNRVGAYWDLQEKIKTIVPVGINGEGEWYHLPSDANCADRPSRLDSRVSDVIRESEWQEGKAYLAEPFVNWPWERKFADKKLSETVPKEELAAKYRGMTGAVKASDKFERDPVQKLLRDGYITNSWDKLIDKTEPTFRWLAKVRAKLTSGAGSRTSRDLAKL